MNPAPNTANQPPALNDRQKWERSMARWPRSIDPRDVVFGEQLEKYQKDLKEESVHNILVRDFANYEIRKFELGFVDKKRHTAIYERQRKDAEAYRAKLSGPPFNAVPEDVRASLAFKLTMLYFGSPVEPMRFTDPLDVSGPLASLGFTSLFQDEDDEDEFDEDLTFVPEELRPLRYLNSYDKRGYGRDNSHMTPEKTYELYYSIPMMVQANELEQYVSLRGGGDDDDCSDDQPSVMGDDESQHDEDSVMGDDIIGDDSEMSDDSACEGPTVRHSYNLVSLRGGSGHETGSDEFVESSDEHALRTTGPEKPMSWANRGLERPPKLSYSTEGFPLRGERLDDFAKGKLLREWSYSQPLSINMEGQHPAIPINAPPLENLLKVPGHNGLPADCVPVVSTQVMTPKEQRQLQGAFFQMRTFALNRAQPCPYEGCREYFPVDSKGMVSFRNHLKASHVGTNCPFCTTPLFAHWTPRQIKDHFLVHHADYFSRKGDLRRDAEATTPSLGLTHRREEQWNFCSRCGRDHNLLSVRADRANHDNRCYPGVPSRDADATYCRACGEAEPHPDADEGSPHVCGATAEARREHAHCTGCALPTHVLSRVYAHKHLAHCKGAGSRRAAWCPWCGVWLAHLGPHAAAPHIEACALRPAAGGEGPVDASTGAPRASPRDGRSAHLAAALHSDRAPGQIVVPVPERRCPFEGCQVGAAAWRPADAAWLEEHFRATHRWETQRGRICPLCDLDFASRQFNTLGQKVGHYEDHVHGRAVRIAADKLIAASTDWSDPTIQLLFNQRDGGEKQVQDTTSSQAARGPPPSTRTALGKRSSTGRDDEAEEQGDTVQGTTGEASQPSSSSNRTPKRVRTRTPRDPSYRPPVRDPASEDEEYVRIESVQGELSDLSNYSDESGVNQPASSTTTVVANSPGRTTPDRPETAAPSTPGRSPGASGARASSGTPRGGRGGARGRPSPGSGSRPRRVVVESEDD